MTRYLSPADIATALGISRRHAYRLLDSIPHVHVGRLVRVCETDLLDYLHRNEQRSKERPWAARRTSDARAIGERAMASATRACAAACISSPRRGRAWRCRGE